MTMGETGDVMPTQAMPDPLQPTLKPKLPGLVGLWVGIALVAVGIVAGAVFVVAGVRSFAEGFNNLERVPAASGGTVVIEEPGTAMIYGEYRSAGGGAGFNTSTTPAPAFDGVRVFDPSGDEVPVDTIGHSESYDYDGRSGFAVGSFVADTAGPYEIRPVRTDGGFEYEWIAVGQAFDVTGIFSILGGVFGGGAVVLLGVIIIVISVVRRSGAKRRLSVPSPPPPYPQPGYGPPQSPIS